MSSPTVSMKLERIAEQSVRNPDMVFTTLAHLIDVDFLRQAFGQVRANAAPGVDGVTWHAYAEDLEANLLDLHERLRTGTYRATPVRRSWLGKEDGSARPLGLPILEDKIVQRAVVMLLEAVYESVFENFSYGFRRHRSAHQALAYLRTQCLALNINWIVDADVSGFFDNIDHKHLIEILKRKVKDGAIIRLIGKWLNAGVLEEGHLLTPEKGTPQGGVISPMLANIYLHTILDEWFRQEVQPRLGGASFIVRFADDFVIGCTTRTDAERVFAVLPKRFQRFGLTIHPKKSRLVQFSRPYWKNGKGPGTFDFLGFTHFWSKTLTNQWTIKRKTRRPRLRRAMKAIWAWCQEARHWAVPEQHKTLCAKLQGHYGYYAITGNYKALEVVYEYAEKAWKTWLGRRTRNGYITWDEFDKKYRRVFPLPKPHIVHNC